MKEGATMMRTRRGPGLVGVLARTAVIPGTTSVLAGRVARWEASRSEHEHRRGRRRVRFPPL